MESTQSGLSRFGAECSAVEFGLGSLPWPSGAAGGDFRRRRAFPRDLLPGGGLAGDWGDAGFCETKPTLLASRGEKNRFREATGGGRGIAFGCAVHAAAEKLKKGDRDGQGDNNGRECASPGGRGRINRFAEEHCGPAQTPWSATSSGHGNRDRHLGGIVGSAQLSGDCGVGPGPQPGSAPEAGVAAVEAYIATEHSAETATAECR